MNLSETLDRVNSTIIDTPIETLYTSVQQHALIVSMKELYGWLTIAGALCILLFMITESTLRPKYVFHPKYKSIRRFIKHQLRLRKKWEKSKKEIAAIETSD